MRFASPRWLNSFSRQFTAASAGGVLFLAGLILAGVFASFFVQGRKFEGVAASEYAELIGQHLEFDATGQPVAVNLSEMGWLYDSLSREVTFRVLNDAGAVLLSSEAGARPLTGSGEDLVLDDHDFSFNRDGISMHGATEIMYRDGSTWYLQFAASERLSELLRSYIARPLFTRSFVVFFFAALLVYGVVMRLTLQAILKPLNEASAIATKISPRKLGERIRIEKMPDELRPLVENFNGALDRLENNYRLQQEFLASAAHELKTPLALIRAQIEMGVDETNRDELLRDVSRMGRQVQQLLHLAEASEPESYSFAPVDLDSLIHEVANYLERLADQQSVLLQVIVEPAATIARADRGALFTLLKNLIENAIQHSAPGGLVQISADSNQISIEDDGPGVSPEDIPNLFTRFWRGPGRQDLGAGLGLAICMEIATAHGWKLSARCQQPGMVFHLTLSHGRC